MIFNNTQTNTSSPDGIDNDALNLSRAIRKQEGGNYTNYMGDGGTSAGAYQWQNYDAKGKPAVMKIGDIPTNFKTDATKFGLDPNDFSQNNQDRVGYEKVKYLKDKNLNIFQVASSWNAGEDDPEAYKGTFKNGKPSVVAGGYDVPQYAKNVDKYYGEFMAKNPSLSSPTLDTSGTNTPPANTTPTPDLDHINEMFNQGKSPQDVQDYIKAIKAGTPPPPNTEITPVEKPFNYASEVGKQISEGIGHIGSSIAGGAETMASPSDNALEGIAKLGYGAVQSFLGTFGGALQTVLSPVTPIISKMVGDVVKAHPAIGDAVNTIAQPLNEFAKANPKEAGVIGDGINALLAVVGEKLGGEKLKVGGEAGEVATTTATDATKMTDRIMPKPTAREAQLAMRENRLIPGKEPGLFTAGEGDTIAPTPKQIQTGQDIVSEIPGANKMSDQELFTATKNYIGDESKRLYPELQKTIIKPEDFNKAVSDAEALQKIQANQTTLLSDSNLRKIQNNFENALFSLEGKTGADAWDATKAYDDTFKNTVKSANRGSSDLAQEEKDLWLSNRKILTDLRDSTGEQLQGGSKESFRKMSNMYEAQRGLLTEAKSNLAPQPSRYEQWKIDHPKIVKGGKVAGKVLKYGAVGTVVKHELGL